MIDTLIIHQASDPYGDYDFRNTEPERLEKCPNCGRTWRMSEVEDQECDHCGYPENEI